MVAEMVARVREEDLEQLIREIAGEILDEAQNNLDNMGSITPGQQITDTAELSLSGHINAKGNKVIFDAPHASFIEFGTDPHMPPTEPLKRWAIRKLGQREKEAQKTAWRIAIKIKTEGTIPKPFLRNAVDVVVARHGGTP